MREERLRRENVRKEWISEEFFYLAILVGLVLVSIIGWRACVRSKLQRSGYQELLGTARSIRRRFSSRGGGEEAIWLAETPEQGSVFELGMGEDDEEDEEEEWAKRRIRRRSSSIG
jgi:hypothetical protein